MSVMFTVMFMLGRLPFAASDPTTLDIFPTFHIAYFDSRFRFLSHLFKVRDKLGLVNRNSRAVGIIGSVGQLSVGRSRG